MTIGIGTFAIYLLLLFVFIVVVGIIRSGFYRIQQYQKGLLQHFGRYVKILPAGLHWATPWVKTIRIVDMRERVIDVPPQSIISQDNVVLEIDAVVYYEITDPEKAIYDIQSFEKAIIKLAQTTLRNIVGEMDLDKCLTSRDTINTELGKVLDQASGKWGTKVNRIEVQKLDPPDDIQKAMHQQKTSEQLRRSKRIEAEGDKEAAEHKRDAAIHLAEGDKKSRVLRAEGEAQAITTIAEAQAGAIQKVSTSANKFFKKNAQLYKKLTTVADTFGDKTKVVVPSGSELITLVGLDEQPRTAVITPKKRENEEIGGY